MRRGVGWGVLGKRATWGSRQHTPTIRGVNGLVGDGVALGLEGGADYYSNIFINPGERETVAIGGLGGGMSVRPYN